MTKDQAREIQVAVAELIASHPEWNVKVQGNRATYGENELRLSVSLVGTGEENQRRAFERDARWFSVKPTAFGAFIPRVGTLIGFNTKRPKYAVTVKTPDGRTVYYTKAILTGLAPEHKTEHFS
jgi:hypothetical protein